MYLFARILVANYRRVSSLKNHIEYKPRKFEAPAKLLIGSTILQWLGVEEKSDEQKEKDQEELIMTIKRGVLASLRSEFEKSEQLYHLALRNAQTMKNEQAVTYVYDLMANLAYETGKLVKYSFKSRSSERIFILLGQLEKAEKLFVNVMQRVMGLDNAQEDDVRILHISSKVAHIAYLQENMDKAMLGYNFVLEKIQSKDYLNDQNYHELYGVVKNLIGQAFIALKKFPEAKAAFLEAHAIFKKYKDELTEDGMILLNNLSCACAELKEYSSAQDYLKEAIKIADKIRIDDVSPYHVNMGMLYFKQKLFDKAKSSCSQGYKMAKEHENTESTQAAERCLDEVKKAMS